MDFGRRIHKGQRNERSNPECPFKISLEPFHDVDFYTR